MAAQDIKMGLRDRLNSRNFDSVTGLPYMSTAGFLSFLKKQVNGVTELSKSDLKGVVTSYFSMHGLYNPDKGDAGTKDGLLSQFFEQFYREEVWKKIDLFSPVAKISPTRRVENSIFAMGMFAAVVAVGVGVIASITSSPTAGKR